MYNNIQVRVLSFKTKGRKIKRYVCETPYSPETHPFNGPNKQATSYLDALLYYLFWIVFSS